MSGTAKTTPIAIPLFSLLRVVVASPCLSNLSHKSQHVLSNDIAGFVDPCHDTHVITTFDFDKGALKVACIDHGINKSFILITDKLILDTDAENGRRV